jgi:D-threo-aldose 1-dehydrogenase
MATMKTILVSRLDLRIPVIGFGCSALTSTGRANAIRVLETAFDAGVRHFDVARYYGYGEAEGILGSFIKRYRSQLTITTKFGIAPPQKTPLFSLALGMGRRVGHFLPILRPLMRRKAQGLVKTGTFTAEQASASLDASLRQLRTDHVDFYLLHDYSAKIKLSEDLLAFLESVVKTGKVRCLGMGTDLENILLAMEQQPQLCGVIQFQNSVLTRNTERLPSMNGDPLIITHGSLGESSQSIRAFLERHNDLAKQWSARVGADLLDQDILSELMLNYAIDANPNGLVLFSSRDPARVKKNVRAVLEPSLSPSQTATFASLVCPETIGVRSNERSTVA